MKYFVLVLAITGGLMGCKSGFNREAMMMRMNEDGFEVYDENGIKIPVLEQNKSEKYVKPVWKTPAKIAVFVQHDGDRWSQEDKATFERWSKAIIDRGYAREIFMLPSMLVGEASASELRKAAHQTGADCLLVIRSTSDVDKYLNPLGMLYLTGLGCFVVPGSTLDGLCMIEGVLFDVRTGHIWAGVQSEGESKVFRPVLYAEEKHALRSARRLALERFGEEALKQIEQIVLKNPPEASTLPTAGPSQPLPYPSSNLGPQKPSPAPLQTLPTSRVPTSGPTVMPVNPGISIK